MYSKMPTNFFFWLFGLPTKKYMRCSVAHHAFFLKKKRYICSTVWTVANHEVQVEAGLYKTDFMIQFPFFCVLRISFKWIFLRKRTEILELLLNSYGIIIFMRLYYIFFKNTVLNNIQFTNMFYELWVTECNVCLTEQDYFW